VTEEWIEWIGHISTFHGQFRLSALRDSDAGRDWLICELHKAVDAAEAEWERLGVRIREAVDGSGPRRGDVDMKCIARLTRWLETVFADCEMRFRNKDDEQVMLLDEYTRLWRSRYNTLYGCMSPSQAQHEDVLRTLPPPVVDADEL
jgi:hypothetical protein